MKKLTTLENASPETRLEEIERLKELLQGVIDYTHESRGKNCMYCKQNCPEFVSKYGHAGLGSPAFFHNGRWHHLSLQSDPQYHRYGRNWWPCRAGLQNGTLVKAGFKRMSLDDILEDLPQLEQIIKGGA